MGTSENNRKAKFYSISKAGGKQLVAETQNWERVAGIIGRVLQLGTAGVRDAGYPQKQCARIRALFRTSDLDRDFEEELQSHVAMLTRTTSVEADTRRGATRGIDSSGRRRIPPRATSRSPRLPAFDSLLDDLRFASRLFIKDRWFTAAVVAALALGVGVNTTVFTVINGWNLRDLPVDEPGRLMHLGTVMRTDAPVACHTWIFLTGGMDCARSPAWRPTRIRA